MHKVAILTYDRAALFELGCAAELFALPRPEFPNWYQSSIVSFDTGPLASLAGLQLQATSITRLNSFTVLVIPSWPTEAGELPPALARAVRKFHAEGKRILSFCSGAFLLARLGLLDGRRATTHWRYAEKFKALFPQVDYVDDVLYVYDGILGCSAGSAAAIDLGIEVIRQDHGYRVANQVARRLVMSAQRQGGQSQFVEAPVPQRPGHFTQALDWALKHLSTTVDIDAIAAKAKMSRRSFDRKFRSSFNQSPLEWLTAQKVASAKTLLEQNTTNMDSVATKAGFENAGTLRHHFRRLVGIAPSQYRAQFFRGKR